MRRDCDWRDPEIYITLVLDIVYAYNALMLLFGLAHCCSLLCGELPSYFDNVFLADPLHTWASCSLRSEQHEERTSISTAVEGRNN